MIGYKERRGVGAGDVSRCTNVYINEMVVIAADPCDTEDGTIACVWRGSFRVFGYNFGDDPQYEWNSDKGTIDGSFTEDLFSIFVSSDVSTTVTVTCKVVGDSTEHEISQEFVTDHV